MIPHRTPFFLPLLYPSLHWRFPVETKELYLTFDDGPVPGPTEFVLDTLERFGITATFFCIGDNVRKHPAIFKQIIANGHAIGNHTFHHMNGWKNSLQNYCNNIALCDHELQQHGWESHGRKLFRPPYGRITRKQISALNEYAIIMWDVLSIDYNRHLSAASCLRNTTHAVRPGSVIVFHDSVKAEKNLVYALPQFISHCLDQGYAFKAIEV